MAETIGHGECINCGATVPYKVNAGGLAFYRCEGQLERRACGLKIHSFGIADTKKLIAKFKKEDRDAVEGGSDDGRGDDKPAADNDERSGVEPSAPRGRKAGAKAKSGGGAFGALYD